MEDLMGMFGNTNGTANGNSSNDLMNGFASLDMNGGQQPPPQNQMSGGQQQKTKEDLLGLF
jgi:hypothetical protein